MNFSYGIIAVVGILVAISLVLISISPDDVIEPREISQKPIICSMDYAPVCGIDGETYSNFCVLEASDVRLDYGGVCVDPSSEVEMETEVEMENLSIPLTIVLLAEGSGIPGCETTNECYLPYEITVSPGTTVTWNNDDSAAHTVTSGSIDAGLTGIFDSSIFMTGTSFEFTFDEVGTYDYFCMVHPWMTGIVNVV